MPIYEYEHEGEPCAKGRRFDVLQKTGEPHLTVCPECGRPVRRLISRPNIALPVSDSKLKNLGFSKLVKREKDVYENVTAGEGEPRFVTKDSLPPDPAQPKEPKTYTLDE